MVDLVNAMEDPKSHFTEMWDRDHDRYVLEQLLKIAEPDFSANTTAVFRRVAIQGEALDDVARDLDMTANACLIARSRVMRRLREIVRDLPVHDDLFLTDE